MLGRSSASKALVKGVLGRFPAQPDAEVLTNVLRLPGSQPRRIAIIVADRAKLGVNESRRGVHGGFHTMSLLPVRSRPTRRREDIAVLFYSIVSSVPNSRAGRPRFWQALLRWLALRGPNWTGVVLVHDPHDVLVLGAVAVFLMFTVWHVPDVGEQAASPFLRYGDSAEFIRL